MHKNNTNNQCAVGKGTEACKQSFAPHCDVYEKPDAFVIISDIPGVDEKDVDVKIEKNHLSITANVESASIDAEARVREYRLGDYKRVLELPRDVDASKAEASMKNGVLKITLPKLEEQKARKVEVRVH